MRLLRMPSTLPSAEQPKAPGSGLARRFMRRTRPHALLLNKACERRDKCSRDRRCARLSSPTWQPTFLSTLLLLPRAPTSAPRSCKLSRETSVDRSPCRGRPSCPHKFRLQPSSPRLAIPRHEDGSRSFLVRVLLLRPLPRQNQLPVPLSLLPQHPLYLLPRLPPKKICQVGAGILPTKAVRYSAKVFPMAARHLQIRMMTDDDVTIITIITDKIRMVSKSTLLPASPTMRSILPPASPTTRSILPPASPTMRSILPPASPT